MLPQPWHHTSRKAWCLQVTRRQQKLIGTTWTDAQSTVQQHPSRAMEFATEPPHARG
jgi:hypothetical protein